MLVDPDEHPSFYKLLFKEGFVDKILMPPAFINENKSMLAKTCLLKTDEGVFWEAKIVREKFGYFICEGEWPKFVEYHELALGDVLLFFLIDKSTFQVLPYKQKRYKNLPGRQVFEELSSSSKEEGEEEEEVEEEVEEEEEPPRKSNNGKRCAIEYSDEEELPRKSYNRKRRPIESSEEEDEQEDYRHLSNTRISYAKDGRMIQREKALSHPVAPEDGVSPRYSNSGGESNGEASNVLHKKKAPPGLKLLLKACQERPTNSMLRYRRKRPRCERDPDKPKQPTTAFFVFMEEFRKQIVKQNPLNRDICVVGKAGGDRWKQLTEAEKAPYIHEAEKRKVQYKENMRAYYERKASTGASKEDVSDKSRSAVVEEEVGGN